jgi:hypothetical protein
LGLFSVQRIEMQQGQASSCVTVEAKGPLQAGELVLAEPLQLSGRVVRAKIWYLRDDWTPQSVSLYSAEHV